jgi:hypothetical protein
MVYNGFPATYSPYYQMPQPQQLQIQAPAQQMPQPQQKPASPIIWVQGEAGARAYPVAPGESVMMLDSDASIFYIKTADQSGMPLPLRTFDFVERKQQQPITQAATPPAHELDLSGYVTRKEFEAALATLKEVKTDA